MKTNKDYWRIDIPKGLTLNQAIEDCKKLFPVWTYYDDLDKEVAVNDRTSEKAYTVWVKANIEADEENINLSADDLKEKGHRGITLLERLVLELNYFKETGKHLDIDGWTLCSGSRYRFGYVPCACWYGEFYVNWYYADNRRPNRRSRSVFETDPSTLPLVNLEPDLESAIKICKEAGYRVAKIIWLKSQKSGKLALWNILEKLESKTIYPL